MGLGWSKAAQGVSLASRLRSWRRRASWAPSLTARAHSKMVSSLLMSSACNPVFLAWQAGAMPQGTAQQVGPPAPGWSEPLPLSSQSPLALHCGSRVPPCTPWAHSPLSSAGSTLQAPPAFSALTPGSSVMSEKLLLVGTDATQSCGFPSWWDWDKPLPSLRPWSALDFWPLESAWWAHRQVLCPWRHHFLAAD